MTEDTMTVGKAYAFDILNTWNKIKTLGDENRASYLQGRADPRKYSEYVSLMVGLWLELNPKIQKRSEFGELSTKFADYEPDFTQPAKLYMNPGRSLQLQVILREALERLKITRFDEANI